MIQMSDNGASKQLQTHLRCFLQASPLDIWVERRVLVSRIGSRAGASSQTTSSADRKLHTGWVSERPLGKKNMTQTLQQSKRGRKQEAYYQLEHEKCE